MIFLSFLIVALGHFENFSLFGVFTSLFGYALFWKGLATVKRPFLVATVWFALLQGCFLFWMTSIEYQGIYILFVYLFLLVFLGIQWGVMSRLVVLRYNILLIASLWTLFEWGRQFILCGFSLNPLGLALASTDYSLQWASIWGVLGLSFWVMWINLAAYRQKHAMAAILFLIPYLFGVIHIKYHDASSNLKPISVAIVQTDLLPSQKVPMRNRIHDFISHPVQWENILKCLNGAPKADYIILPEAALPFGILKNGDACQELADYFGAEVIVGLDDKNFNAAFHFIPHSDKWERIEKQVLLPLAEYLPFEWARSLTKYYGITEFFTPGSETKIFTGKVPVAVSICYEETFSSYVRKGRQKGGELLVNLSNDAWYPYSILGEEHFKHGKIRAIENGAYLVRACNMGVSGVVDSLGRTVSKKDTPGVLFASFVPYSYKTFYGFWGDMAIIFLCLLVLFFKLAQNIILGYPFTEQGSG